MTGGLDLTLDPTDPTQRPGRLGVGVVGAGRVGAVLGAEVEEGEFDAFSPANISPVVAYLSTADCPANGKVYAVQGGAISELEGWTDRETIETEGPWLIDDLAERLPS